jgi:hypothetical protein
MVKMALSSKADGRQEPTRRGQVMLPERSEQKWVGGVGWVSNAVGTYSLNGL